jgi:2-polyprenyl-3-methyl-5-hydroxy-6-metoxy-1,4-benzoquinol methylase
MSGAATVAIGARRLDRLSFSSHDGLNARLIDLRYRDLSAFYRGRTCLEFGCADGRGLDLLLRRFANVTAVDGSARLLAEVRRRVRSGRLRLDHALFEDLDLGTTFDTVQLGHVLEHVESPRRVLEAAMRHLAPRGVLIADVPNADSLHRHLGVALGMLADVTDLHEGDHRIGHRRVYTWDTFGTELRAAGLHIVRRGGVFLKPLSNDQMERMLSAEQIDAFFAVGRRFPRLAAEIFAVCRFPRATRAGDRGRSRRASGRRRRPRPVRASHPASAGRA